MSARNRFTRVIRGNLMLLMGMLGIMLFRTAVADWNYVPSGSMEPTLYEGDMVWVNKTAYGPSIPFTDIRLYRTGYPRTGDVITFYPPHTDDLYVKRVVGVPGDIIEFRGADIVLNGQRLPLRLSQQHQDSVRGESQLAAHRHQVQFSPSGAMPDSRGTFRVPEGQYFVLGDHRTHSADSRYWGFVDVDQIMGKVTHVALSFSSRRTLGDRFARAVDRLPDE